MQNGKVLYERENGFADFPNKISNTIETKFASASAGKVFVAVGILQLIERGRIKFDDTLGMLLDMPLNDIDKDWRGIIGDELIESLFISKEEE